MIKWKSNNPIFDSVARRYDVPRIAMRKAFESTLMELEAGEVDIRTYLQQVLGSFGKGLREGDSPDELWTGPFEQRVRFMSGTLKVVESLRKKGHPVYLFSNTSAPHADLVRRMKWDKHFDGLLCSCEIGAVKPEAAAFRRALSKARASPSEVVFVDDREINVQGALDFGIGWAFRFTTLPRLRRDLATWLRGGRQIRTTSGR